MIAKSTLNRCLAGVVGCGLSATALAVSPSPWDYGGPEIDPVRARIITPGYQPAGTPIEHVNLAGEAGLFGYNPRYMPGTVTFDRLNRPYITVGYRETRDYPQTFESDSLIQTLNNQGQWVVHSLSDAVRSSFNPNWNGQIVSGTHIATERVVIDSEGDAYTLFRAVGISGRLLLHSRDGLATWDAYQVSGTFKMETPDTFNDQGRPPVLIRGGGGMHLLAPRKRADGRLTIPAQVQLTNVDTHHFGPTHSGLGNVSVTKGNLTHVVYVDATDDRDAQGRKIQGPTNQYIISYNHTAGAVTPPLLLGSTIGTGKGDPHNGPALTIDSVGYLHSVLGSHQTPFAYTDALGVNSSQDGWTTPQPLSGRNGKMTYVSLVTDASDTMHLVSRHVDNGSSPGRNLGEHYELHYMRRSRDANGQWLSWQDMGTLVEPYKGGYAIYYHELNIDRLGRLFLSYKYYNQDMINAGEHARNPAMLMSDDGGNSWRLALTDDFINGIIHNPGDANLDGRVNIADLGILGANWQQSADWYGGDFNGDGVVNIADLGILAGNWQFDLYEAQLTLDDAMAAFDALRRCCA
jgi:hypothetical protein